jgi:hypothetical protein
MAGSEWLTPAVSRLIDLALEEDLGRGDITTDATVGPEVRASGSIVAREAVVIAGLAVAAEVFRRVDPAIRIETGRRDGDEVPAGGDILQVSGPARGLLRAERTALNFLQRLSGIATLTRAFVRAIAGTRARIADTRKTFPGARPLERPPWRNCCRWRPTIRSSTTGWETSSTIRPSLAASSACSADTSPIGSGAAASLSTASSSTAFPRWPPGSLPRSSGCSSSAAAPSSASASSSSPP